MTDYNTMKRVQKLAGQQTRLSAPMFDGYLVVGAAIMVAGSVAFWLVLDLGLNLAR